MLSLHSLSLHKHPTLSFPHLSFITRTPIFQLLPGSVYDNNFKKRANRYVNEPSSSSSSCVVAHAAEQDSQQFEIDPEEAKAALQKLDQQLQTLSKKQISSPKIRAADVKLTRGPEDEETTEISGSLLTNTAIVLLIFTIFYNVLFYGVIKPSIDGPDEVPELAPAATTANESPKAAVLQSLPPVSDDSVQR